MDIYGCYIKIKCLHCNGSGYIHNHIFVYTEGVEHTPPLERFKIKCLNCDGTGVIQVNG